MKASLVVAEVGSCNYLRGFRHLYNMKRVILLNQIKIVEWGLKLTEAIVFSYCIYLAGGVTEKTFLPISFDEIIDMYPSITGKKDTIYRHIVSLEEKGVLAKIIMGNKTYISITAKGIGWLDNISGAC